MNICLDPESPLCDYCGKTVQQSVYAIRRAKKIGAKHIYCDAKCFGLAKRGPRAVMTGRTCRKCKIELTDETWYRCHQKTRDNICKSCIKAVNKRYSVAHKDQHSERAARWRRANPSKVRAMCARWKAANAEYLRRYRQGRTGHIKHLGLKRVHGISLADYSAMMLRQDGRCAICNRHPSRYSLNVDHNHVTGRIRGLLCIPCNTWLGRFENVGYLHKVVSYLKAADGPIAMPFEGFF